MRTPAWRLYYAGRRIDGRGARAWRAAPDEGVQVVVLFEPTWPQPFAGAPADRRLLTGLELYDPFGWGAKRGSLIADAHYFAIWERALADPGPPPV